MAIALDQKYVAHLVGTTTTTFGGVTVTPGGNDRLLVVGVAIGTAGSTLPTVSGVTYGGVAMTSAGAVASIASQLAVHLWYTIAPVAGTANVVVTTSSAPIYGLTITATSWTGVHQTTPVDPGGAYNSATGTSSAPSVTVTAAANDVVLDVAASVRAYTVIGAGQTLINSDFSGSVWMFSSQEAGAASVAMSWTLGGSARWVTASIPIYPSSTTSPVITPPVVGDGGTQATSAATIAEMRIAPYRAAPTGFSTQTGTAATIENNAPAWEASGLFPKVLMGTINGSETIWDDLYTLPSVATGGVLRVCAMPTPNSPTGSLLVTTQDMLLIYPLPYTIDPVLTPHPRVAASSANASMTSDHVPVFYPSAIDLGTGQYEVLGLQCIGENFTDEVDSWAFTYRWDETRAWETVQRQLQPNALFTIPGGNQGRTLHIAISINDGVNTDPIGPMGDHIVLWVKPLEGRVDLPKQPARQNAVSGATEVS